jgi:probable F420-dependent oxidoreductase
MAGSSAATAFASAGTIAHDDPRGSQAEDGVDFGIHIGTRGCLGSREAIMAVAQRAEALGYAYMGVADHLIVPVRTDVRYPYTADGIWPGAPTGECLDCIATLAFLAGCTQRIRLLTSVAVVPYRPAVLAAKLFLTADALSGGRVIAGVGTGWMREEFEALGAPPYAERGAVTDEYLRAWRALWDEERPALQGRYARFDNVVFAPKPAAKPHLPIWVGGESAPALRRTVRFGDAWYPASNNQQIMLDTPARLRAAIDGLHRVSE